MYQKEVLNNGVRIVTEEVPGVHSVTIGIWVHTGSRHESERNHGVSHFLEHMLFKGTARRSARQIAEELESVGGSLNAFTTKEYTCYYAKVLVEHLDLAIDVLTDMFFNSVLDGREVEKEKKVVLEEIKLYEDSPDELVHDLFAHTVWDGHPLGRAILGTEDAIRSLRHEDIIRYYQERYTPENTVVAVAGRIHHQEVVDKLVPHFAGVRRSAVPVALQAPVPRTAVVMKQKDTEQVQICVGAPGLAQLDDEIYVLHVLNNVLGGGLSSRLFQEIREERGLAYSIYSYQTAYVDAGLFTVYAGTSPENVPLVMDLIMREMAEIKKEGITPAELARTKEQLKGNLLLSLENVTNRMMRLGKNELIFNRFISIEELLTRMAKVELEDVHQLAHKLFDPEKFTFTSIGPPVERVDMRKLLSMLKKY